YLNVDSGAVESRPLDVACDPAELSPFADGSAEEIFAANLVDRLPPERARGAVVNWVRVLRPGGRLAVETPNLAAAGALLAAPPQAVPEGADQRALATIFGHGDPSCTGGPRLWGYTPHSLAALLAGAGLRQIKVEAIRPTPDGMGDMRATAIKP
ncbi:MAG: methyltransferase domain-containing protein, partial [Alphaproteobacteria bacterium]|nr:methyltransferase domain-containing protein [Alphaproteobacteria bacterium]